MTNETEPTPDGNWIIEQKETPLVGQPRWVSMTTDYGYERPADAAPRLSFLDERWPNEFRLTHRVTGETLSAAESALP